DGQNWPGDTDTTIDEGCQILDYWNMPILLAGMSFVPDSSDTAAEPECNTLPKNLQLMTRNVIDGIGTPLTMIAQYPADGTLKDQELSGTVDTWFDRPTDGSLSGFSLRLRNAYLNQVTDPANPPSYGGAGGFTVLSGLTDVPLFNDVSLAGHFSNRDPAQSDDYTVSIFADQTELDTDFDGVPDGSYGTVLDYRNLSQSANGLPKPTFEYSWPSAGFIDLSYPAGYNQSTPEIPAIAGSPAIPANMPQFLGVRKSSDIAGVLSVESVPDFINPERTKFSFGASAQLTELANMQIDVGSMDMEQLGNFLKNDLHVKAAHVDAIKGSISNLVGAEQLMHDMTGGDLTPFLRKAIEDKLQELVGTEIDSMVRTLNDAQQAPNILSAKISGPLSNLKAELLAKILPPEIDLADLYTRLAPFTYVPDTEALRLQLRAAFIADGGTDVEFDAMQADYEKIRNALQDLQNLLGQLRAEKNTIKNYLNGTATQSINSLHTYISDARTATTALWTLLEGGIGGFASADPGENVLLGQLETARNAVQDARNAVESVHLGEIADYLFLATLLAGSPLDTSFIRGAEETMITLLDQVDAVIASADGNMQALYDDIGFVAIYQQVEAILGPASANGLVQNTLNSIDVELNKLSFFIPAILDQMDGSVEILLNNAIAPLLIVPGPDSVATWADAMIKGQGHLDAVRADFIYAALDPGAPVPEPDAFLEPVLGAIGSSDFVVLFSRENLEMLLTAPFDALLESVELQRPLSLVESHVAGLLPHPSSADIRRMISAAIVNSDAVQSINTLFYAQIGRISDVVDDISTQLALQINSLIKETLAAVNQGLNDQLGQVTATLGLDGVKSAGINGFALVSQDEIERIHLEAEFTFSGDPDPTSYNAALDVSTWNTENGKGACLDSGSKGNVDVVISTHDVPADLLGTSVGIKEAALGFTMGMLGDPDPVGAYPRGVFGRLYTSGEINFEAMILEDLGLESAIGLDELYFGATGAGRFQDYSIPKAVFYLGKSCTNDVLVRLDPEVAGFILGTDLPDPATELKILKGVYVRGSLEVPIYNNGCALTAGVGADIGAWYFTEPDPAGTYGGLLGGSAYGQLACLASLKGSVTAIGQKSGTEYKFAGSGWAAAGVGYCSPSKWKKISHARKDDWCLTGDASFEATFNNGDWSVSGPDVSCCH
ncbi:MAG: hypothetical protein KKG47_08185, partial [Proteobacteria bacterium]|nr:hypothetical protein [Pseudomonadota bacterium]